jgi:hypothetical protein
MTSAANETVAGYNSARVGMGDSYRRSLSIRRSAVLLSIQAPHQFRMAEANRVVTCLSRAACIAATRFTTPATGLLAWQGQRGILTPREVPLIVVVRGEEGRPFGYDDYWDSEGVFHSFGAGQEGDMTFVRGDLALRDHAENGEDVHLSSRSLAVSDMSDRLSAQVGSGATTFQTEPAICVERLCSTSSRSTKSSRHRYQPSPQVGGDQRWTMPLTDLPDRATREMGQRVRSTESRRTVYQRSADLKVYVLRRLRKVRGMF